MQTTEQKDKVRAVRDERKKFKEIPEDLRKKHRQHKEKFERAREPLLQGLASKNDLKLFKEAQARACEVLVRKMRVEFHKVIDHAGQKSALQQCTLKKLFKVC